MTTKDIQLDNYFVKDGSLVKVTSLSGTKVNSNINPSDLNPIPCTSATVLAAGFVQDMSKTYRCTFADYITIPSELKSVNLNGYVKIPIFDFHVLQNIVKNLTRQSLTIDEEALRDAALGHDLDAPVVTLDSRSSTGFIIEWEAVDHASGYKVSIDDGVTYGELQEGTTFTKEDATATTEYDIKVVSIAGEGSIYRDSYPGALSVVTLTPLDAPVLVEDTITDTTFELSWDAITNAVGYKVSIDGGATYGDTQVGVTFTKNDATPATEYVIKVKAIAEVDTIYEDSPASTALEIETLAE